MSMAGAGMAANVVGGELQGWSALLAKWAMQKAYKDEIAKQAQYRGQAQGVFNKALPTFGSQAATPAIQQGANSRMQQYQMANAVPLGIKQPNQSAGNPAAVQMRANMFAQPRANFGGYGDWQHGLGIASQQEGRDLGQISNFAGGDASVFPYKMYDAQHSWDQLAEIGAAISSIGGAAANYAQFAQSPKTAKFAGKSETPGFSPDVGGYSAPGGYSNREESFLTGPLW